MSGRQWLRADEPVTLAEQLVAWTLYRETPSVCHVAQRLRRYARQTRAILFGDPS